MSGIAATCGAPEVWSREAFREYVRGGGGPDGLCEQGDWPAILVGEPPVDKPSRRCPACGCNVRAGAPDLARKAAPGVVVNGVRADEVEAWEKAREGGG